MAPFNLIFRRVLGFLLAGFTGIATTLGGTASSPLTTLEYRIAGQELRVSPAAVSVPKGIAGSVAVTFSGDPALAEGAFVTATFRGPSFPARELFSAVGQPLLLPPLSLVGDYQLDGIRMARIDGTNTVTLVEGSPASVPVRVFDDVLVSRVTSRPLTSAEITERGIVIDESNFRAVEFEVGFVLDGRTIPVRFPVVAPTVRQTTEIIPAAELQARLVEAQRINEDIMANRVALPPELQNARLNIQTQPIGFQPVDSEGEGIGLSIPPIPALMVIPGDIGFLNQFFSVQLFTENAAPSGSGLSVVNVRGPPGGMGWGVGVRTEGEKPAPGRMVAAAKLKGVPKPLVRFWTVKVSWGTMTPPGPGTQVTLWERTTPQAQAGKRIQTRSRQTSWSWGLKYWR